MWVYLRKRQPHRHVVGQSLLLERELFRLAPSLTLCVVAVIGTSTFHRIWPRGPFVHQRLYGQRGSTSPLVVVVVLIEESVWGRPRHNMCHPEMRTPLSRPRAPQVFGLCSVRQNRRQLHRHRKDGGTNCKVCWYMIVTKTVHMLLPCARQFSVRNRGATTVSQSQYNCGGLAQQWCRRVPTPLMGGLSGFESQ